VQGTNIGGFQKYEGTVSPSSLSGKFGDVFYVAQSMSGPSLTTWEIYSPSGTLVKTVYTDNTAAGYLQMISTEGWNVYGSGTYKIEVDDPIIVYLHLWPGGVGGGVVSVDKFSLLAPYIGLASTIMVATVATAISVKRAKHRKEKK